MKTTKTPLNLSEALIEFGILKDLYPGDERILTAARLGQRLVRETQHLHTVLLWIRQHFPMTYHEFPDPRRLDVALARTVIRP